MTPEEKARLAIDEKLNQSGWVIQDMKRLNLSASLGVAVREFPTSTGEVDYALFVDGKPVGVVEARRSRRAYHGRGSAVGSLCQQHLQMDKKRVCHSVCL